MQRLYQHAEELNTLCVFFVFLRMILQEGDTSICDMFQNRCEFFAKSSY